MPDHAREQAKQVILKIVAISGGKLPGKLRLNKAFYAAHVIYWREHEGVLTEYPVVKLPDGPAIDDLDSLLAELETEGALEIGEEEKGPYMETVFTLKTAVTFDPADPAYEPIRRAVQWAKKHTTSELTRLTHGRPSYEAQSRIGYEQPIYLDALSEEHIASVRRKVREADAAVRAALDTAR